jgi:hypothetical protein
MVLQKTSYGSNKATSIGHGGAVVAQPDSQLPPPTPATVVPRGEDRPARSDAALAGDAG